jgi:hypothetical protein
MDGVALRAFLRKKAQCAIRNLAPTNRARWVIFSPFAELTPLQFADRLGHYGVSVNPAEVVTLWRETGVFTPTITYESFLKFLYHRMPPSQFDMESRQFFFDSLAQCRSRLMSSFLECDPDGRGVVTLADFTKICQSICPQSIESNIQKLAERYDTQAEGSVNYYLLLSDLAVARPASIGRGPNNAGYGPLDPEIFSDVRRSRTYAQEAPPPVPPRVSTPPLPNFARTCPLASPPRICHHPILTIQKLASAIESLGSAKQFFNTFQKDGFLGAEGIERGTQFSLDDIQPLVALYGGPFTLSQWVHLISDGAHPRAAPVDFAQLRRMIEDDVVLTRIATRTRGTNWEELTSSCTTCDEFVQALRKLKIHISVSDIRDMYESHGKDAFIDAIKSRTTQSPVKHACM